MYKRISKVVGGTIFVLLCTIATLYAAPQKGDDIVKLINIAGKQRMLSQRIAKDYLYIGKGIAVDKASKQLKKSLEEFERGGKILSESINDPEIKNLLAFVDMSLGELKSELKKPFTLDNAQLVLDLSESMLEGSQYIVSSLKEKYHKRESDIVAKSGRQRMLAQRIAKYYIAYQVGIKDKNTVEQTKRAVEEFGKSHQILMKNKENTPEINRELKEVDRLWNVVYKFYINIKKGGLPLIVYNTTDDITGRMDNVTNLYVKIY
jgi:nitrate/nitrite-specific signal transduction histidine kinase